MNLEAEVLDLEGQVASLEADLAEAEMKRGLITDLVTKAREEIETAELNLLTAKQYIDELPD
jgi:hypothetical protein